jgi:hypothetical protein
LSFDSILLISNLRNDNVIPIPIYEPLATALGREWAAKHAHGDPNYSVAEEGLGGAVIKVLTDRPHASLIKAASMVGIGRANVRLVGSCVMSGMLIHLQGY